MRLPTSQEGPVPETGTPDLSHEIESGPRVEKRLLRRSKQNRVIAGVCGGLGRYVDADPVLFRIAFLVSLIPGGLGLVLYVIAWVVIPEFKTELEERQDSSGRPMDKRSAGTIVGGMLIVLGSLILLQRLIDWFDPQILGGATLLIIGAIVLWRGLQSEAFK